jgi:predicted metal-dependent peptidase
MDEEGGPASVAERGRQQQEWSIAAEQSMRSAAACGHEPLGIDRPLQESRRSQQDWREILRHFVSACSPHDYRWTPPNRRFISSGMYLPSIEGSGLGTIVIAVDTSGSIGERQLQQFAGEISSICDETHPESIMVIYCDAEVQGVEELEPSAPVELAPKGGGGTDFRPVFNWIEDKSVLPTCLIYLTDLCCHSYPDPPEYPVLWVTDGRRIAPFGETLQVIGD